MPASPARCLVCRNCGAEVPLRPQHACFDCFGPLEVGYDGAVLAAVTREQIESGPANMWRYAPLLPVGQEPADRVTLDPGLTPARTRRTRWRKPSGSGAALWVKDDSANPTHSFKDRVVSVA